jgi:hypothetical protein
MGGTEQRRLGRTVKIQIEQTDSLPGFRQQESQRGGHGTLADAAFAGQHHDFFADLRQHFIQFFIFVFTRTFFSAGGAISAASHFFSPYDNLDLKSL